MLNFRILVLMAMLLALLLVPAAWAQSGGVISADTPATDELHTGSNRACFNWDCDSISSSMDLCVFTPCSFVNVGTPVSHDYHFGDGVTGSWPWGNTAYHIYTFKAWATVTMTDKVVDGPSPSVTCDINIRNVIGPPQPTEGQCAGPLFIGLRATEDGWE